MVFCLSASGDDGPRRDIRVNAEPDRERNGHLNGGPLETGILLQSGTTKAGHLRSSAKNSIIDGLGAAWEFPHRHAELARIARNP